MRTLSRLGIIVVAAACGLAASAADRELDALEDLAKQLHADGHRDRNHAIYHWSHDVDCD